MSILIITTENDPSTDEVMNWLRRSNTKVLRINESPALSVEAIDIFEGTGISLLSAGQYIRLDEINSFWHRRGNFTIDFPKIEPAEDFPFGRELQQNLREELRKTGELIHYKLRQKKHLGNYFQTNINKLIVLEKAASLGISIPPTLITTRKSQLTAFRQKHREIICKAISESVMFSEPGIGCVYNYTYVLTEEALDKLETNFALSLFQKKVDKKLELRIFYLNGEFYPMAIFSQSDSQTLIDFRKYNWEKPNRTVPFNLPTPVKDKLHALMTALQLNTGSIDMALTKEDDFVFFEVNPVGQFGMTSYPCNYYIEKKIAKFLSHEDNETKQDPAIPEHRPAPQPAGTFQ